VEYALSGTFRLRLLVTLFIVTTGYSCVRTENQPAQKTTPFAGMSGVTEKMLSNPPVSILTSVRSAAHTDFDRIVFEFDQHIPGYRLEYLQPPLYHCGSGEEIPIRPEAVFQFRFTVVQAHDDAGKPTVPAISTKSTRNVEELRIVCDFEGEVILVAGLRQKKPYRMSTLQTPPRIVVDFQH
jgi:hypothetical protein